MDSGRKRQMPSTQDARARQKISTLARTALFGSIGTSSMKRLAAIAEWRSVPAGTVIFRKLDSGDHIFVVHMGQVKFGSHDSEGREITFNLVGPGEVFGEMAFADRGPRTADAVAAAPTELLVLARRDLVPFLLSEPQVMLQMMSAIAERARWISDNFEDAVFLNLPQRLAKRLLFLSLHFGLDTEQGRRLTVSLPHRELANHMNVTRESINRLIQKWRSDGVLEERRGIIVIKDMRKLNTIAASRS